jgi:two-component system cell cycle sensor histidine kinase/response regulator CckA
MLGRTVSLDQRYMALLDQIRDAVFVVDTHGLLTLVNPAMARLAGRAADELLGQPLTALLAPEDRGRIRDGLEGSPPDADLSLTMTLVRPDGASVDTVARARRVGQDAVQVLLDPVARSPQHEERLRHAQRMEVVGRLASGIAHDFNNLLTAIVGYCDLLEEQLGAADVRRSDLEEIRIAAMRGASLTRQLLALGRRHVSRRSPLDLNALLQQMDQLLERLVGGEIAVVFDLASDLLIIEADRAYLEQVVLNLATNARDAMPEGGTLTVRTSNEVLEAAQLQAHPGVRPGLFILLEVSDTGTGMTPGLEARIFEPFFTTKEPSKGTGLGLSTVQAIVSQGQGFIELESAPGRGSKFRVHLPAAELAPLPHEK